MALHDSTRLRMLVANGYPVLGVTLMSYGCRPCPRFAVPACSVDAVELSNCSGDWCEFRQSDHIRTTRRKIDSGTVSSSDRHGEIDWFADRCWRLVNTHTCSGQSVIGSLSDLIDVIRDGHRVLVQISTLDAITAEADAMQMRDDHTSALLLHVMTDDGTLTPTNVSAHTELCS